MAGHGGIPTFSHFSPLGPTIGTPLKPVKEKRGLWRKISLSSQRLMKPCRDGSTEGKEAPETKGLRRPFEKLLYDFAATRESGPAGRTARQVGKSGSRPVSRVLSRTVIPLGRPSPDASSSLPGCDAGHTMHPYLALLRTGFAVPRTVTSRAVRSYRTFSPLPVPEGHRRSVFCGTFRRLAPPRRYLASCPAEPGLSSTPQGRSDRPADSRNPCTRDATHLQDPNGRQLPFSRPRPPGNRRPSAPGLARTAGCAAAR